MSTGEMNKYQFNKTLSFGLTLKDDKKKKKSHEELKDLVDKSFQAVEGEAKNNNPFSEKEFLKTIEPVFNSIKEFHSSWKKIYFRTDQIAVTKDFYRILCRKARFDGFWYKTDKNGEKIKQPQSQLIKLSYISNKYQGIERHSYITNYWKNKLNRQEKLILEFSELLEQYKVAVQSNDKAHKKPNLVNFNKMFLSLINVINDVLVPVSDGSIQFPDINKSQGKDQYVVEFATENWREVAKNIKDVKDIISENCGYTPYAKVTLNRYTAEQKPHDFKQEIENKINELGLVPLIEHLKDLPEEKIREYFENLDKKSVFNNTSKSVVERAQCFKYKPISVLAKYGVAKHLSKVKRWDEEDVLKVLNNIGVVQSPAFDYSNLEEEKKNSFDLSKYPLKVAFDYAWEQLARSIYRSVDLPEIICKNYLKDVFNCDIKTDVSFKLYAELLYVKEHLATLEHGKPNKPEDHIGEIKKTFKNILLPSSHNKHRNTVLNWLNKRESTKEFEKAKQQLGFLRGGLKNKIRTHLDLTNTFKTIASDFGKNFADLRDKFSEENELNKISHFGIVIEDKNFDRYLLLKSLQRDNELSSEDERKNVAATILDSFSDKGDFKTYQVKSLTSKSFNKIVKNEKTYKDFHQSLKQVEHNDKTKKIICENSIDYIKDCLQNSKMSKDQNWNKFGWNMENCKSYEDIETEIDRKSYTLQENSITKEALDKLVENGAVLFPIVNQDITSERHKDINQFSKDWKAIFENEKDFRLHPEFKISYRTPTENIPKEKRYGRLQFIAHFNCETIPQIENYTNRKELLKRFNNSDEQQKAVEEFNEKISETLKDDYVVIGIDRGLKQLATLCVLNKNGVIQGGFDIYEKKFIKNKLHRNESHWKHTLKEKRDILDLSNLRVETTVAGEKVLVDQSLTKVKKDRNSPDQEATEDNQQKIKLKQLAYIRKLQFQMQTNGSAVLELAGIEDDVRFEENIKNLISPYGEGNAFDDLPVEKFREMINRLKEIVENGNDENEKNKLIQLDAADDLKRGVVANMVGVANFILQKYNYNAYLSLENLTRAWGGSKDGLNGRYLPSTNQDQDVDFKEQQNQMLAGLGTYQFFEMQLLKKLSRIHQDRNIVSLVPQFRSVDNYENIMKLSEYEEKSSAFVAKPFGVVHFIDPKFTSKKCPVCGETKEVDRNFNKKNIFKCKKCGFISIWEGDQLKRNEELMRKKGKDGKNLNFIHNGDDNGAYHIALKTVKNLASDIK